MANVHSPCLGSTEDGKDANYEQLEWEFDCCHNHDTKIVIRVLNAQVGHVEEYRPVIASSVSMNKLARMALDI